MASDSTPRWTVQNSPFKRTIVVRMEGLFDEPSMRKFCDEMLEATRSYRGMTHLYLADMRGMRSTYPEIAEILGAAIGESRRMGVVGCAHVSDDTMQRLQALRVARQNSPYDDVTVDAASLEEAERILEEMRRERLQLKTA